MRELKRYSLEHGVSTSARKSSLQLKVRMVLPGGSKLEKDETNDMQTHLQFMTLQCAYIVVSTEISLHHRFYLFRSLVPVLRREFPL